MRRLKRTRDARSDEKCRSGPVSRVLSRVIISLGCWSPSTSRDLPGRRLPKKHSTNRGAGLRVESPELRDEGRIPVLDTQLSTLNSQLAPPCLVLLPVGFALPVLSPATAVRSYRTFSPLPAQPPLPEHCEAVCFLWHCPCPRGRWVLPTTVSCGARTFLHAGRSPQRSLSPLRQDDYSSARRAPRRPASAPSRSRFSLRGLRVSLPQLVCYDRLVGQTALDSPPSRDSGPACESAR